MTPAQIRSIVGDLPHTSHAHGEELYNFIRSRNLRRCLELGFYRGVGTVWMAGAIQSLGGEGSVVAVDVQSKIKPRPAASDLLNGAGLSNLAELHEDPISYTWHLKRNLAAYAKNPFDFVFIDGAHTWDTDGLAFFLVERVLKVGGWILFDDLNWSYATSPSLKNDPSIQELTEEARNTRQVRDIWNLLVLRHPSFGNFIESGNWGWAQKISHDEPRRLEIRSNRSLLERLVRKLTG